MSKGTSASNKTCCLEHLCGQREGITGNKIAFILNKDIVRARNAICWYLCSIGKKRFIIGTIVVPNAKANVLASFWYGSAVVVVDTPFNMLLGATKKQPIVIVILDSFAITSRTIV